MTVFAALLFAFAALVSARIIVASWLRHGRDALALRARLDACPEAMVLTWRMIERVPVPALPALRTDRKERAARLRPQEAGLVWPGAARRPLELAA